MGQQPAEVIAVAGDAGGARAVCPVVQRLRASGRRVAAYAYRQARQVWPNEGLDFEELLEGTAEQEAEARLRQHGAARLLVGTSCNGVDLERRFTAAARRLGVPCLAVLDFWSNYRLRFTDGAGELKYVPDRIAVMDDGAAAEMAAAGFNASQLVVTGQPAFDTLSRYDRDPQRLAVVRSGVGVRRDERMVLFSSQPLSTMTGAAPGGPAYPGYTEHTVLAALTAAMGRIGQRTREPLLLLVRPHPREDARAYAHYRAEGVRVCVDARGDARDVALAAHLVTGMTTVLLVEACLLGCIVASLQPGLCADDVLPTNRLGASRPVYREEEIEGVVESLLLDPHARAQAGARTSAFRVIPGAAQRVVQALDSLPASQGRLKTESRIS